MDYLTEYFVMNKLNNVKSKGIVLFITHRDNLAEKYADRIYKLEDRKLLEFNTYEDYHFHQKEYFKLRMFPANAS